MTQNTEYAYNLMSKGGYTCVMYNGERVYTSSERGVKPLLNAIENKLDVKGFSVADKVVGKAAALLYVLLDVSEIYAEVMSMPAAVVLKNNGIACSSVKTVPLVENRTKTGYCPMESAVLDIDNAQEGYAAIKNKLEQLRG